MGPWWQRSGVKYLFGCYWSPKSRSQLLPDREHDTKVRSWWTCTINEGARVNSRESQQLCRFALQDLLIY